MSDIDDLESGIETAVKADFPNLPPEGAAGETAAPRVATRAPEEEAVLSFEALSTRVIDIQAKFFWEGRLIASVAARPLTYAEVARVYERAKSADGDVKIIEFVAEMIGLPAAVIRGMEADDANAVMEGCYDFLPRSIKAASVSPSPSPTGGGSV